MVILIRVLAVAGITTLLTLLFASNILVTAQDEADEFTDLQSIPEDKTLDSTLTDDYVNCPPEDPVAGEQLEVSAAPSPEPQKPSAGHGKFEDYAPVVKDEKDRVIRLPGMRPRGGPFDEVKIIDDQADVELLDMTENLSVGDIGEVFENVAESVDGSGDDEVRPEQETVERIHVPVRLPTAPKNETVDPVVENTEAEGLLKHLKAEALYDLAEGETKAQGVKKFLEQHPEEIILESPNYPNPYPNAVNDLRNFSVDGGRGVQITIHDLDLNPTTDFLYIRAGNLEDTEEKGPVLTGTYQEPLRFLIPQTNVFTIHFVAQQDAEVEQKHRGFQLTYASFGNLNSPTTPTTTEVIVPQEELQWTTKEIVMTPEMMDLPSTWTEIKQALSNASNMYIESHNLTYMPSRSFDVRLLARKCPDTWRNHQNCVSLEYAVPLRPIFYEPTDDDDRLAFGFGNKFLQKGFISISTTEATEPQYELDVEKLNEMWEEFGQMELQRAGYELYIMPESSRILLTWIGISLAIVCTFLFVLYMIWKIDIFKDYRRISRSSHITPVDDDKNELKKKEFDISMFPSPHQVVPTFFPTGDPYGAPESDAQYAYDNATMSQWPEDFNDPRYPETSFSTGHPQHGNQRTGPTRPYEPVSPMDLSPAPVDFNVSPRSARPSAGSRNNPFLSPRGGGLRTSRGNQPPPPPPPPGLR
uniref:CUB domain-containing protein n=1 Tax=Anopheles minimus TaxID=112268 RepID=A0A182W784_9DIPT